MSRARGKSGGSARPGGAPPGQAGPSRTEADAHATADRPAKGTLEAAAAASARGDLKAARQLALEAMKSGSDADRAAARRILDQMRPDPVALIAASAVLLAIALAAWLALFKAR